MRKIVALLVAGGVLGLMGCTQPKPSAATNRGPRATDTGAALTPPMTGTPTAVPSATVPPAPPKLETPPPKAETPPPKADNAKPGAETNTPVPGKKPG